MPHVAPREAGLSAEKLSKVNSIVQAQVDKKHIAGAVVLVARQGKVALCEAFGKLDVKSGQPMRPDAIFRIYSMTKPITSVAALMLVEKGKLKPDDPVASYLPELKDLRVYAGQNQTVEAKRPVTIRDLMRHTSGFTYGLPNGSAVDRLYIKNKIDEGTLPDMIRKLGTLPLQDQPGTRFNYGYSTDVLGRVIEVVAGEPLDKFLRERILQPLDMRDTGFTIADEKLNRFSTAYARPQNGTPRHRLTCHQPLPKAAETFLRRWWIGVNSPRLLPLLPDALERGRIGRRAAPAAGHSRANDFQSTSQGSDADQAGRVSAARPRIRTGCDGSAARSVRARPSGWRVFLERRS